MANIKRYYNQPNSPRKRWYEPVPIAIQPVKVDLCEIDEKDLQELERLVVAENVCFE